MLSRGPGASVGEGAGLSYQRAREGRQGSILSGWCGPRSTSWACEEAGPTGGKAGQIERGKEGAGWAESGHEAEKGERAGVGLRAKTGKERVFLFILFFYFRAYFKTLFKDI